MSETTVRNLSFSIQGEFITNLAREKLYDEYDFPYAIKLLLSCTETDQISIGDRIANALAILDGRKELKGTYPGSDYGLYDVPEDKRDDRLGLEQLFDGLRTKIQNLNNTIAAQSEKIQFLHEHIPDYKKKQYDQDFESEYEETADGNRATIFGTNLEDDEYTYPSDMLQTMSSWNRQNPKPNEIATKTQDMMSSFMARMSNPVDEPDYGWLFPDGTFHPVEWGEHQSWADTWLTEHDPEYVRLQEEPENRIMLWNAGDYLSEHHKAVLIHSPWRGIGEITAHGTVRLNKKQKDFLYDYYIKRNQTERANALYQND